MSEKLTVAELMARNAKDGAGRANRPRRRRNLEDGGVSVSELTGSIPVVSDEDIEQDEAQRAGESAPAGTDVVDSAAGADSASGAAVAPPGAHPYRGGHQLADGPVGKVGPESPGTSEEPDAAVEDVPTSGADAADGIEERIEEDVENDVVDGEVVEEVVEDPADDSDDTDDTDEAGSVGYVPAAGEPVAPERTGDVLGDQDDQDDQDAASGAAETSVLPRVGAESAETAEAGRGAEPEAEGFEPEDLEDPEGPVDPEDPDTIIEYEDDAISWPALLGQTAVALVIGVVIFFGFTLLWDKLGTALVLVMSGVVTLVCVGVVHALLRHRHTLVLILAFIVGLVITLGPRLIMSI